MAASTTAIGLKIVSSDPPKISPPVMASPPLMLFYNEEHSANSTAMPTAEPLLALSMPAVVSRSIPANLLFQRPGVHRSIRHISA